MSVCVRACVCVFFCLMPPVERSKGNAINGVNIFHINVIKIIADWVDWLRRLNNPQDSQSIRLPFSSFGNYFKCCISLIITIMTSQFILHREKGKRLFAFAVFENQTVLSDSISFLACLFNWIQAAYVLQDPVINRNIRRIVPWRFTVTDTPCILVSQFVGVLSAAVSAISNTRPPPNRPRSRR